MAGAPWEAAVDIGAKVDPDDGYMKCDKNGKRVKLNHGRFAQFVMEHFEITRIGKAPAMWDGFRWRLGWEPFDMTTMHHDFESSSNERKEVCRSVDVLLNMRGDANEGDPRYIQFSNVVLDLVKYANGDDDYLLDPEPEMYVTNIIPHEWNPDVQCDVVDDYLEAVSAGREEIMNNIVELWGMCLYRDNHPFQQVPVLSGPGGNGKGVCTGFMRAMYGADNVSNVALPDMNKPFMVTTLAGKLANFDDDVSSDFVTGNLLSLVKRLSGGDTVQGNIKYQQPFDFVPYSKLVICANEMFAIKSADMNDGLDRRLHFIPFDVTFKPGTEGYDPFLSRKLATEEACQRGLKLAVDGLVRLIDNAGKFSESAASEQLKLSFKTDNDTIAAWVEDAGVTAEWFTGYIPMEALPAPLKRAAGTLPVHPYTAYKDWCSFTDRNSISQNKWTRRIKRVFGLVTSDTRVTYHLLGRQRSFELANGGGSDASDG